jgi:glycosyltransferase involved in cell wall biosynthesis
MKLLMNGWPLLSPHTGIGSYVRNLAESLQKMDDMEASFFYGRSISSEIRQVPVANITKYKSWVKKFVPKPYEVMRGIQQFYFSRGANSGEFDIYHEPSFKPLNFRGPTVITVHDLSPIVFSETHPADRVADFKKNLPKSLKKADKIITDSDFIKNEIIRDYGFANKITTTLLGVSAEFRPREIHEISETLSRFNLGYKNFILAVGTIEPRKNLLTTIKAYQKLKQNFKAKFPLVIIGMKGWQNSDFDNSLQGSDMTGINILGYVSQPDLLNIYSAAGLFVYPSLYEGFGLPILEAMASGVPVITSNRASLPEVAGDAAITIEPHDVDALADNMLRCLDDVDFSKKMTQKGIDRAKEFTWDRCARQTVGVYKSVL